MKYLRKTVLLLLVFCMLIPFGTACNRKKEKENGNDSIATGEMNDSLYDEKGYLKDSLPENLNYGKKDVNLLFWEDVEKPECIPGDDMGDIVNAAIQERNLTVEARLGVKLNWRSVPGNYKQSGTFISEVRKCYEGGTRDHDIIAGYSRTAGMLATMGYYTDLTRIGGSYLDFEKPWWPKSVTNTLSIGDSLYYISGDISTMLLHVMYGIYYNKTLLANHNLGDPTTMVREGTWTIDELIRMSRNMYNDEDGDGSGGNAGDPDDFYGFCTIYYGTEAFYTGSGLRLIEADREKILMISSDYGSEKADSLASKISEWLKTEDCNAPTSEQYRDPFVQGRALFCQERCYLADNQLKYQDNMSYGVLPTPKYTAEQEDYITCVGNPFTLYAVMNDVSAEDQQMCTAVLECLGSEAYRLTTPAVFDNQMKTRYSENGVDAEMYDTIRRTISFDLGRIFGDDMNLMNEVWSQAVINGKPWKTTYSVVKKLMNNKLDAIVNSYKEFHS